MTRTGDDAQGAGNRFEESKVAAWSHQSCGQLPTRRARCARVGENIQPDVRLIDVGRAHRWHKAPDCFMKRGRNWIAGRFRQSACWRLTFRVNISAAKRRADNAGKAMLQLLDWSTELGPREWRWDVDRAGSNESLNSRQCVLIPVKFKI